MNFVLPITILSIDASTVTRSYQKWGVLPKSCFFIRIVNDSNQAMQISWDGTNDNEYIAPNSFFELNVQTNSQPNSFVSLVRTGTIFFIRSQTAGATGTVTLSGYYNPA
jgi:hypothetical protein